MITKEEWSAVKLSATKKDFYQIWNELLDTASKLSYRWDPQNTNESDPGIVLLKVLTAVADKLNYNVDVNSLEAFMPSAAQEESMRKLTEMLGYNMKYYQSAMTKVRFSYLSNTSEPIPTLGLEIPKFTNIKDLDDTVNYVTTEQCVLTPEVPVGTASCIEGELVECESDDDNIISVLQLDDNNRYYLPEISVAENGIFVNNIINERLSEDWDKVDNLNTRPLGTHCFKFGFDSKESRPYIQFPDDITNIIEDGLRIKYIRTNGINGNVAVKVLQKFEKPEGWPDDEASYYNPDNYAVANNAAATNGCNPETMNDAYNNYKKTIGTFETLVACRDYMNKIYNLTVSDTDTRPLVSNIIVTDIRNDINKAYTLCTFGEHGIEYKNKAKDYTVEILENAPTTQEDLKAYFGKYYKLVNNNVIYTVIFNGTDYEAAEVSGKKLDHFDLIFYPFTATNNINNKLEYVKSFKYDDSTILEIKKDLEDTKTIAHNIILPDSSEITCIKDYYTLNVKIVTVRKVNLIEQKSILDNVYTALFKAFNMRKVDFGEELVEEQIQTIIKEADPRIKDILWNSPDRTMKVCAVNGSEYDISHLNTASEEVLQNKFYYNKLALNNVLAGRISLFNYDTSFKPEFNEVQYPSTTYQDIIYPATVLDPNKDTETLGVSKITSAFTIKNVEKIAKDGLKLNKNEFIQFRLPNLKTTITYPAYVNYFLKLSNGSAVEEAQAATMITLGTFINEVLIAEERPNKEDQPTLFDSSDNLTMTLDNIGDWYKYLGNGDEGLNFGWSSEIGFYKKKNFEPDKSIGYLVDGDHYTYTKIDGFLQMSDFLTGYYLPCEKRINPDTEEAEWRKNSGVAYLGKNGHASKYLEIGEEYQLRSDEYLLINYTHATSTDSEGQTEINDYIKPGTIIKPNFKLYDSEYYRTLHNYNKTEGYDFSKYSISDPAGMFTLGTNEQIEVRDFITVQLNENQTNLYWTRQDENSATGNKIEFKFDEEPISLKEEGITHIGDRITNLTGKVEGIDYIYSAYTLKSGEYFYYTDKDFTDLAWYGSGTKITRHVGTPEIYKLKTETNISVDEIASNGLTASIPWRSYLLSDLDSANPRSLLLTEYQYKNLSEGDVLNNITLADNSDELNGSWKKCVDAKYTLEETGAEKLPPVDFYTITWEVKSGLVIDLNKTVAQVLNSTDNTTNSITITYNNGEDSLEITPQKVNNLFVPIAIKANKVIQTTNSYIYLPVERENEEGTLYFAYDTQIKVFKAMELKDSTNTKLNLNNFKKDSFTKIIISEKALDKPYVINLNAVIPANELGLLMMYCSKLGEGSAPLICLQDIDGTYSESLKPAIFNHRLDLNNKYDVTKPDTWWDTGIQNGYTYQEARAAVACEAAKTTDTAISSEKTYYTRAETTDPVGELVGEDASDHKTYRYTAVAEPTIDNIDNYYEVSVIGSDEVLEAKTTAYELHKGINIIKLNQSCTINLIADSNTDKSSTIIFSSLDIIKPVDELHTNYINQAILYNSIDEHLNSYEQLLKDIESYDPMAGEGAKPSFYYNTPISNETVIDLINNETLADTTAWHSYNNINNQFVISEISAEGNGLKGIEISKNSKL